MNPHVALAVSCMPPLPVMAMDWSCCGLRRREIGRCLGTTNVVAYLEYRHSLFGPSCASCSSSARRVPVSEGNRGVGLSQKQGPHHLFVTPNTRRSVGPCMPGHLSRLAPVPPLAEQRAHHPDMAPHRGHKGGPLEGRTAR